MFNRKYQFRIIKAVLQKIIFVRINSKYQIVYGSLLSIIVDVKDLKEITSFSKNCYKKSFVIEKKPK